MTDSSTLENASASTEPTPGETAPIAPLIKRHRWPVRVMHWINVIVLTVLLGSGLQIFNAHPQLDWGHKTVPGQAVLAMTATQTPDGELHGHTRIGSIEFGSTGLFGVSTVNGQQQVRGFPAWATIPGPQWLALGRRWHFFFAWLFVINGLCYVGYSLLSKHLARDLTPTRRDWRGIGRAVLDHLRLKHPRDEQEKRYNILQKLAYLITIFVFGGGIVLMGLAMSPRMDTVLSPLVDLVGGRQSARTIHFIIACGFVAFTLVHVFEVLISGPLNQLRGMITGWYRMRPYTPYTPQTPVAPVVRPAEATDVHVATTTEASSHA